MTPRLLPELPHPRPATSAHIGRHPPPRLWPSVSEGAAEVVRAPPQAGMWHFKHCGTEILSSPLIKCARGPEVPGVQLATGRCQPTQPLSSSPANQSF